MHCHLTALGLLLCVNLGYGQIEQLNPGRYYAKAAPVLTPDLLRPCLVPPCPAVSVNPAVSNQLGSGPAVPAPIPGSEVDLPTPPPEQNTPQGFPAPASLLPPSQQLASPGSPTQVGYSAQDSFYPPQSQPAPQAPTGYAEGSQAPQGYSQTPQNPQVLQGYPQNYPNAAELPRGVQEAPQASSQVYPQGFPDVSQVPREYPRQQIPQGYPSGSQISQIAPQDPRSLSQQIPYQQEAAQNPSQNAQPMPQIQPQQVQSYGFPAQPQQSLQQPIQGYPQQQYPPQQTIQGPFSTPNAQQAGGQVQPQNPQLQPAQQPYPQTIGLPQPQQTLQGQQGQVPQQQMLAQPQVKQASYYNQPALRQEIDQIQEGPGPIRGNRLQFGDEAEALFSKAVYTSSGLPAPRAGEYLQPPQAPNAEPVGRKNPFTYANYFIGSNKEKPSVD